VSGVKRIYTNVDKGEPLALYGSSGFLEIAVNAGSALDYLGLRMRDVLGTEVIVRRSGHHV
jgi:S-adenosylmethionine hydrolase